MANVMMKKSDDEENPYDVGAPAAPAPTMADANAPAGSPPAGPAGGAPYTQSSFASGRKILQKNQGATQPDLTQDFKDQAAKTEKTSADNLAGYKKGLESSAAGTQADAQTLNNAMAGDNLAFNKISGLLGGQAVPQLNDYQPTRSNLNIQDINALSSSAGVENALQKKAQKSGNYGYTQGQAALDALLFGRSGGRQQVASAIQKKADIDQLLQNQTNQANNAQAAAAKQISDNQSKLREMVSGSAADLTRQASETAERANRQTSGADILSRNQQFANQKNQIIDDILSKYNRELKGDTEARLAAQKQIGKERDLNIDKYLKSGAASGPQYTDQQALQFNRLMEMLGSNQRAQAGSGVQGDVFDTQSFTRDVESAAVKGQKQLASAREEARLAEEAYQKARAEQAAADERQKEKDTPVAKVATGTSNTYKNIRDSGTPLGNLMKRGEMTSLEAFDMNKKIQNGTYRVAEGEIKDKAGRVVGTLKDLKKAATSGQGVKGILNEALMRNMPSASDWDPRKKAGQAYEDAKDWVEQKADPRNWSGGPKW